MARQRIFQPQPKFSLERPVTHGIVKLGDTWVWLVGVQIKLQLDEPRPLNIFARQLVIQNRNITPDMPDEYGSRQSPETLSIFRRRHKHANEVMYPGHCRSTCTRSTMPAAA